MKISVTLFWLEMYILGCSWNFQNRKVKLYPYCKYW